MDLKSSKMSSNERKLEVFEDLVIGFQDCGAVSQELKSLVVLKDFQSWRVPPKVFTSLAVSVSASPFTGCSDPRPQA